MIKGKMFRKGNRVAFNMKGEVKYGIVTKGGRGQIDVTIDGGLKEVTASALCFQLSDHPLPKDKPSEMDRYSLKGYREIDGHGDSRTFSATICENGKPVLKVMNDGWGGSNAYQPVNWEKHNKEAEERFFSAVKSWVSQFGYADMMEPEDTWVEWWQHQRPFGMTAEWMINDYKESMEKFKTS